MTTEGYAGLLEGWVQSGGSVSVVAAGVPESPGAAAWVDGCETRLGLDGAEVRVLAALPERGVPVETSLWCQLEAGHAGPHVALGQVSGPDWWWLRWDDAGRALVHGPVCDRTAGPGEPSDRGVTCVLPASHVGSCSYTRPA